MVRKEISPSQHTTTLTQPTFDFTPAFTHNELTTTQSSLEV